MTKLFAVSLLFIISLSSCSVAKFARYYASADSPGGKLEGRVYQKKDTSYEIGELADGWNRINIKGGDLAFWSDRLGAMITVNSTCNKNNKKVNYSLKALSDSLLIGITDKQLLQREEITIDGEKATSGVYIGKLDGVSVKLNAAVMKKENCYYDFTYAASQDRFDEGLSDFKAFVSGFRVIER